MKRTWRSIGCYLGFLFFVTGCLAPTAPRHSRARKRASFAVFQNHWIGGQPYEALLRKNSAVILANPKSLTWTPEGLQSGRISYKTSNTSCLGTAVAISQDGYLLTARHCVDAEPIHALVQTVHGIWPLKARVVWRGRDVDLAILKVEAALASAFVWSAKAPEPGDDLAVSGAFPNSDLFLAVAAGTSLGLGTERVGKNDDPDSRVLQHNAPVHGGDSGGPVVDRKGQLLGVNVRVSYRPKLEKLLFSGVWSSEAILPNPCQIKRLIDADRSLHQPFRGLHPRRRCQHR